jgi:hypothetical protein
VVGDEGVLGRGEEGEEGGGGGDDGVDGHALVLEVEEVRADAAWGGGVSKC